MRASLQFGLRLQLPERLYLLTQHKEGLVPVLKHSFMTCKNLLSLDGLMVDRNHSQTSSEDDTTL